MKTLSLLSLIFISTTFAQDHTSIRPHFNKEAGNLYDLRIDPRLVELKHARTMQITLDYVKKEVELHADVTQPCPPDMLCPAVIRTWTRKFRIDGVRSNRCGEKHISASREGGITVGRSEYVSISDFSDSVCGSYNKDERTQVEYRTLENSREGRILTVSTMKGPALRRLNPPKPIKINKRAKLNKFNIDEKLNFQGTPVDGNVTVNRQANEVQLAVYGEYPCIGFRCPRGLPAPMQVKLPIVNEFVTQCNAKIIVASRNRLPVDGMLQTIRVIDNTKNTCPQLFHEQPRPATKVTYRTTAEWTGEKTYSTFEGEALLPLFRPHTR